MPLDDEALKAIFGKMQEAVLQRHVDAALEVAGWLHYHTHDSRRSDSGFPDVVAVRGSRIIYRELKMEGKYLDPRQKAWQSRLIEAGADYAVWRPFDWGRGDIMKDIE